MFETGEQEIHVKKEIKTEPPAVDEVDSFEYLDQTMQFSEVKVEDVSENIGEQYGVFDTLFVDSQDIAVKHEFENADYLYVDNDMEIQELSPSFDEEFKVDIEDVKVYQDGQPPEEFIVVEDSSNGNESTDSTFSDEQEPNGANIVFPPQTISVQKSKKVLYRCSFCTFVVGNKVLFKDHVVAKHLSLLKRTQKKDLSLKCVFCPYVANNKPALESHIRSLHFKGLGTYSLTNVNREALLKCVYCDFTTKKVYKMEDHVSRIHVWHKCAFCTFTTVEKHALKEHIKNLHTSNVSGQRKDISLKCVFCAYVAEEKSLLEMHIRSVHFESEDKKPATEQKLKVLLKCIFCPYTAEKMEALEEHIGNHHSEKAWFKCVFCNFVVQEKCHLKKHVADEHSEVLKSKKSAQSTKNTPLSRRQTRSVRLKKAASCSKTVETVHSSLDCPFCVFTTKAEAMIEEHIKTVHFKNGWYKCNFCVFACNDEPLLNKHIETVHPEVNESAESSQHDEVLILQCTYCSYTAKDKSLLEQHVEYVHPETVQSCSVKEESETKPIKCVSCSFASPDKQVLEEHVRTLHIKKELYKCGLCDFVTNVKQDVDDHIEDVHSQSSRESEKKQNLGNKSLKCVFCAFTGEDKYLLQEHISTVHLDNMKMLECGQCGMQTRYKPYMLRHMRAKHGK